MKFCFCVSFLLSYLVIVITGSELHFSSSGTITPLLTGNLTLTCTLNDTTPPVIGGAVVGRRRRDVSLTSENVHPMSMVIVRGGGEKVASLTQFSAAKSLLNDNNIHVSGKLEGNPLSESYLEVRWEYPTQSSVGDYTCKVSTISDEGLGLTLSKNVSVDSTSPTMDDLVERIHKIEVEKRIQIAALKSENSQQNVQISALKSENSQQGTQIAALTSENRQQDIKISALTSQLQASKDEIARLKKVDTGFVECGDSRHDDWSKGNSAFTGDDGRVIEKTQTFKEDYDRPPIVFLSILEPDYWLSNQHQTNVQFGISLQSVDKSHFVFRCFVESDQAHVRNMRASWISFSK